MDLAHSCYQLTKSFPNSELFGLTSQVRRASSSVSANIAEGYRRDSKGDYVRSLRIAQGSLKELETHIFLSQRVDLLNADSAEQVLATTDRLGRMLRSLIRALEAS